MNEEKQIIITNIINNDVKSLKIIMNKTVKELKKEIESLFGLNYSLNEINIQYKNPYMKTPRTISEQNETKKLYELKFVSDTMIYFGKEKNRGGLK